MTAFAWQTLLLLGLAYLLGCWIACLVRRMIGVSDEVKAERAAIPAAVGATAPVPAGAATQRQAASAAPAAPAAPAVTQARAPSAPVRDAFRRADTLEPVPQASPPVDLASAARAAPEAVSVRPLPVGSPASAPVAAPTPARGEEAVQRFERALAGEQVPAASSRAAASTPEPRPRALAAAGGAAVAAAAAAAAAVRAPAQPGAAPAAAAADDLKRIRTIDQGIEAALNRTGIRSFAQIGAWKPEDVARISRELGFKGRIEQENWIEQAQILATGHDTFYSRRLARGEVAAARRVEDEGQPAPLQASPPVVAPAAPVPQPVAAAAPAAATTPARAGAETAGPAPVPTAAQATVPAPAPSAPAAQPSAAPADAARTRGERSSVEAAAAAAAALAAAAAASQKAAPAPSEPVTKPGAAASDAQPAPGPAVSDKAAFAPSAAAAARVMVPATADPATAPAPAGPGDIRRAVGSSRDNLQRIRGVTPEIEKLLNVQGVSRYSQIAQWAGLDVERFDRLLGHQGRIQRENWIEQAQVLARGGETAHSREFDRQATGGSQPSPQVARVQAPSTRVSDAEPLAAAARASAPAAASAPPAAAAAAAAAAAIAAAAAAAASAAAPDRAAVAARPAGGVPSAASGLAEPTPAVSPRVIPAVPKPAVPTVTAVPPSISAAPPAARAPSAPTAPPVQAPPAPPARDSDARTAASETLASLRSVRTEAPRRSGEGGVSLGPKAGGSHDLKRIRGIGVLIEKKLNSMGVTRYEQIAEWTAGDIERVSQVLDFKGRIERENWVEQARILASGGQTEFSRRADRGDAGG